MPRILGYSLSVLMLTLPAAADPLLEKMRGQTKDGPVYAYEMTYSDAEVTASGKVDPSQPEGQRLEIYTPGEADWSKDFRKGVEEMDAETDGDIWCADFAEMVPQSAKMTTEDDLTATYAFTPKPEADADGAEKKLMKKIKGLITLDKSDGSVLSFNMALPKPYKPAMIVKINRFEMDATCTRAPDGRTYVRDFAFGISGSAMMQSFEEQMSRSITKLLGPVG